MRKLFSGLYIYAAMAGAGAIVGASVAYAADIAIDQVNQKFSQSSLDVKIGDSVHYKNGDDVTHNVNVTDPDGNNEDKGLQKPGETIDETFKKAGEYDVRCSIHPKMHMKVKVS
jgi:plastocyanin